MNIEIQNFKSPKMGLAFVYIYMKILEYPSPPPGYQLCIEFQMLLQKFYELVITTYL